MKSEESTFTDFNFSFITFPRQVFVKFFDSGTGRKMWRIPIKKESFDLSIRRPKLSFMNVYSQSGLDVYFITFS
jgi:hypothetical protein